MQKQLVRLVLVSSGEREQAALVDRLASQGSITVVAIRPCLEKALEFSGTDDSDLALSDVAPQSVRDVLHWRQLREQGPATCILTGDHLPVHADLCCLAGLVPVREDSTLVDSLVKKAEQRTLLFEVPMQVACTISQEQATRCLEPKEREIILLALQGATNSQMQMLTGMSLPELEGLVSLIAKKLLRKECPAG